MDMLVRQEENTPEGCYTFPAKQMYNTVNDKIFYVYGEIEDED
jgi:hypothetical protein